MSVGISMGHTVYRQMAMRGSLPLVRQKMDETATPSAEHTRGRYDVIDIKQSGSDTVQESGKEIAKFENKTPVPVPENVERSKGIVITDVSNSAFYQQRMKDLKALGELRVQWFQEAKQKRLGFAESLEYQQKRNDAYILSRKTLESMWAGVYARQQA